MTPPNSPHLDNAGDRHELEECSVGWILCRLDLGPGLCGEGGGARRGRLKGI